MPLLRRALGPLQLLCAARQLLLTQANGREEEQHLALVLALKDGAGRDCLLKPLRSPDANLCLLADNA